MSQTLPDLPTYIVNKVKQAPMLDGQLRDRVWNEANPINLVDAVSAADGRFSTTVRALYDDEYLYVGFSCEDSYVWGTVTERDGPIWNEECVEVFLNPAHAKHQYYEINVSPKNVIFDAVVLNHRTPERPSASFEPLMDYSPDSLQTAIHVDGELDKNGAAKAWSAMLKIPFSVLYGAENVPPQKGDVWRANFYRIDTPLDGEREHYAWSATGRVAFHLPWRFGFLEFN